MKNNYDYYIKCSSCGKMESGAHACKPIKACLCPKKPCAHEIILEDGNTGESHTLAEEIATPEVSEWKKEFEAICVEENVWHVDPDDKTEWNVLNDLDFMEKVGKFITSVRNQTLEEAAEALEETKKNFDDEKPLEWAQIDIRSLKK